MNFIELHWKSLFSWIPKRRALKFHAERSGRCVEISVLRPIFEQKDDCCFCCFVYPVRMLTDVPAYARRLGWPGQSQHPNIAT